MPDEIKKRAREILETATELFARHGFSGVSVRDICSRLDLNCSTISYYFGGKKGLYKGVLKAQFEAYENALDAIIARDPNPRDELLAIIDASGAIHALCPHLSLITSRESCNPSQEYIQALSEHEAKYQGGHLAALIRAGQRQGYFNQRLNPIYLSRILSMILNSQIIARATCGFLHPEVRFSDADYYDTVRAVIFDGILASSSEDTAAWRASGNQARTRRTSKGLS
ncbi:MAG: TetR family transcriptional regulator [Candidatus Adiutrix sp.]|jgi:AcrR family transcriptional regulator|nr:TetR family transcriptional regulator [Candidatus Adiutrix sp.]